MHEQCLDDGAGIVVLELCLEACVVGGWVHDAVEELFIADIAEQDLDVVLGEVGGERAVVDRFEEGGGDEGVVSAGAEGVEV